jgi:hypothetical protein
MDNNLQCKTQNYKLPQGNTGENLDNHELEDGFLDTISKAVSVKEKN